jgi:four helix bundle protein
VEGFEKNNNNEFIRFLKIAKGSTGETRNQLYIALSIGYITQQEFEKINKDLENLAGQIGGFIVYLEKEEEIKNLQFVNPLIR